MPNSHTLFIQNPEAILCVAIDGDVVSFLKAVPYGASVFALFETFGEFGIAHAFGLGCQVAQAERYRLGEGVDDIGQFGIIRGTLSVRDSPKGRSLGGGAVALKSSRLSVVR